MKKYFYLLLIVCFIAVIPSGIIVNADTPDIMSVPGLPSEFGSPKGNKFLLDSKNYQNYQYGYIYKESSSYVYVGSKNISTSGEETWSVDYSRAGLFNSNSSDSSKNDVKNLLAARGLSFNEKDISEKFKNKCTELKEQGYNLGVTASFVKVWQGAIVQDFRYGDGSFNFDTGDVGSERGSGRTRISQLMYDPDSGEVYMLTGEYLKAFWYYPQLGCVTSDSINDREIINPGTSYPVSCQSVQSFRNGFVYIKDNLRIMKFAFDYDIESKSFTLSPAPYISDRYGFYIKQFVKDNIWYINYEKGAVKAVPYENNLGFRYYYYSLRNFDENGNASKLMESFRDECIREIKDTVNQAQGSVPEGYSDLLVSKFNEFWDNDIFTGFIDGRGWIDWNDGYGTPFYFGDSFERFFNSTADHRYQCMMFIYNFGTKDLTCLKDSVLECWCRDGYKTYSIPVSEEVTALNGDIYQEFRNGTLVLPGGNKYTASFFKGSYEEYLEKSDFDLAETSVNNNQKSTPADKDKSSDTFWTGSKIITAIGISLAAITAVLFIILRRRKYINKALVLFIITAVLFSGCSSDSVSSQSASSSPMKNTGGIDTELSKEYAERGMKLFNQVWKDYYDAGNNYLLRIYPVNQSDGRQTANAWHIISLFSSAVNLQKYYIGTGERSEFLDEAIDSLFIAMDYLREKRSDDYLVYGVKRADQRGEAEKLTAYDDNIHISRIYLEAYQVTGKDIFLEYSEKLCKFILEKAWKEWTNYYTGLPCGGVSWGEDTSEGFFPTCSNGSAAAMCVELYLETGDESYLEWAVKIYDYTVDNLRLSHGLYADGRGSETITVDGRQYLKLGEYEDQYTATYNSGFMISAGSLLYKATGDEKYLSDALFTAEAAYRILGDSTVREGYVQFPNDYYEAGNWFNLILFEGFIHLQNVVPAEQRAEADEYVDAIRNSLDFAYENFYRDGYLPTNYVTGWPAGYLPDEYRQVLNVTSPVTIYGRLACIN